MRAIHLLHKQQHSIELDLYSQGRWISCNMLEASGWQKRFIILLLYVQKKKKVEKYINDLQMFVGVIKQIHT